jgi:hypothetical protein
MAGIAKIETVERRRPRLQNTSIVEAEAVIRANSSGLKRRDSTKPRHSMLHSTIGLPLVTAWILWPLACSKGC